jgi:hypothetical protein
MENNDPRPGLNYWQSLAAAERALAGQDFPAAENAWLTAVDTREQSGGRVFFTERLADGIARLWQRGAVRPGRWERHAGLFRERFMAAAEKIVREGVRVAELRPEDDAERNQPILEKALFLVARSRVFSEEPASAVPLLKGLFRTASRTGRPFDLNLVRHDIPLSEEDRLWMARKGGELLESFVEQGVLRLGSPESQEWAQVFLQLLQPRYFGSAGRMEEERCWLEAITADRLLGRASASVELYRAFLQVCPGPAPRASEARVRLLELLGNTDRVHFPVPRYDEALGAMQSAGLEQGSELAPRFERAIERIEYRRPEGGPLPEHNLAWASVAVEADGRVAAVFWWGDQPRDLAFWRPGEAAAAIDAFLAPCAGRIIAADELVAQAIGLSWEHDPAPWPAVDILTAVLESRLPGAGAERGALVRIALGETQPWRTGWDPSLGHPLLEPPRRSALGDAWPQGPAAGAVLGGLLWLAVRSRMHAADPALRAGVAAMARRGDQVSRFLYAFVGLGDDAGRAMDETFEAWTLPVLWTRPDPYGWSLTVARAAAPEAGPDELAAAPELGRSDLAIVATGNAPAVIAAWGEGRQKWRVVLDRFERLEALGRVAGGVVGPITLIPASGAVHDLDAALSLLEDLLGRRGPGRDALLPLMHWTRLVETHNGDLLDFREVRPRPDGAVPLYDRYAVLVADLPREEPSLDGAGRTWAAQFSQRVRKAGLVAGSVDHLGADAARLDALWGVFEGSDASWVFLDSAAVHWDLLRRDDIQIRGLHALLHTRGGRHLSLLTGAVWLRSELEEILGTWLSVFGAPYCAALADARPPRLRLADRGAVPDARLLLAESMAGQAAWTERVAELEGQVTVVVPDDGESGSFWSQVEAGLVSAAGPRWRFLGATQAAAPGQGGPLVVPALTSLQGGGVPVAEGDERQDWLDADAERRTYLGWRVRLCALEVAARLAGPWSGVDIMDTRWWRLLRSRAVGHDTAGHATAEPGGWSGARAAALSADTACRTFDLPGFAPNDQDTALGRFLPVARQWAGTGAATIAANELLRSGDAGMPAGVNLLVGDLDPVWSAVAARTRLAWEQGELDHWVLLVSDQCPPDAASLVAAGGVDGLSAWGGDGPADFPSPVVRVTPADFGDPALRAFLAAHPPRTVVATGLYEWLPARDREAQESALALRALLDARAHGVILQTVSMPTPWIRFVERVCGARLMGHGAAGGGLIDGTADDGFHAGLPPVEFGPGVGAADRAEAVIRRFQGLLARLRPVMIERAGRGDGAEHEPTPPPGRQLLPLDWLAAMGGLAAADVEQGAGLLRWVARLAGDPLSAASVRAPGARRASESHALMLPRRQVEVLRRLEQLGGALTTILPHWLENAPIGGLTWIDQEHPPVRIATEDLAAVDTLLVMVGAGAFGDVGLTYACPRGLLYSTRRLVGISRPAAEVLSSLQDGLAIFAARLDEVLSVAVPTADGLLVQTGVSELQAEERHFLALGSALGYWRWLGPACPGAMHLVDLLSLADSPTVRAGEDGWQLLGALVAGRFAAARLAAGDEERDGHAGATPGPKRTFRTMIKGGDGGQNLEAVVARVADVAGLSADQHFLVLRGTLGSGRHEALVRGLELAHREAADPGELTIYCPDPGTAAFISRECLQRGFRGPLDVRVPARGSSPDPGRPGGAEGADPSGAVVVMCEVQRFEPETRYRIAQLGRGRRLIMTVDPAAALEPWEHLFLTTPRADDIVDLALQRRLAKRPWAEVGQLVSTDRDPGQSRRRDKGLVLAEYAANLDQCVARIVTARDTEEIGPVLRVVAALPADLDYIAASLQDRGWLAASEPRLDWLLLPGPRELLAAVADALAAEGLAPARHGLLAASAAGGGADLTTAGGPAPALLPRFVEPALRASCRQWQQAWPLTVLPDIASFAAAAAVSPWGQVVFAQPEARERIEAVLAAWGRAAPADLLEQPLWQAWWILTLADLGEQPLGGARPLAILAEAARTGGAYQPAGVYMCQGTEEARRHYEVLGRLTDQALILYQVRSPLPGDAN